MAATRKLQGEIDRCLKKVSEGVETFEDIWKKVHNATNSNQKEKYEADLKKEIKKLQRLRDQIKSWIASAEIKDKSALLENRRLIETQMERFKIVERETKTKAYSKEGLGAAQKMDPAQRIKDDTRNWLTNSISALKLQTDKYESEVELLVPGKKKRLDRDKQDRLDELRCKLGRHKFHVLKLETLLRLLDNDSVEAAQINEIKDNVEYYINSSQEPGFEENEYIYDEIIGPAENDISGTGVSLGVPSSATTDSNNSNVTSGSPSIISGGSPVQSPPPMQQSGSTNSQQQQSLVNNLNYSSDSNTLDTTGSEKRIKTENASNKVKQPVQPTAVRPVANKTSSGSISDVSTNSKIISSTPSKNHHQAPTQQPTAAAIVAAAFNNNAHALTNNVNDAVPSSIASAIPATSIAGHNPTVQQHTPAPSLNSSTVTASGTATVTVNSTAAAVTNNNIQGQSVIQATPTIAFAAVAKNNTSHPENGLVHPATSYAMAAPTVASIVGSNAHQHQQSQLSNLQTNSSHNLQNATLNNTSNSATSITNTVQHNANIVNNIGNNNNSLINCISPNGMVGLSQVIGGQQQQTQQQQQQVINVANSTRASPGLLSPKHMNGLTVSVANNNAVDAISLKTMAQEAINRSVIDTNALTTQGPNIDTRQQQTQQQQHQQQNNAVAAAVAAAITNGPTSGNAGPIGSGVTNLTNNGNTVQVNNTTSATSNKPQQQPTNEAHIPPLLGVAPLGPSPLHKDHQLQFQMMEAAYYHLPTPSDSEKLTTYFHRRPVQTPPHFPQSQLPIYDTVEFYQRLSTDTLFFVFYYMEGSKAQYLAAKALKKQSWRFHTKYMMWFQRHEEPKIINDDYEQGTYIYFDYEKWSQRKKEGFTFEYKYLEDKELN